MRLTLLFMPPAFMLIIGLIGIQAAIHNIRNRPPNQTISSRVIFTLIGAILLTVVGLIGLAWVINELIIPHSVALPPPQPRQVCC